MIMTRLSAFVLAGLIQQTREVVLAPVVDAGGLFNFARKSGMIPAANA